MENITELVKYNVTDAALQQYRDEFLPLTINGIDDKEGYEKVREARLFIAGERVNVEKLRVEFKADALAYGRAVDAEAKRITAAILEVENHLKAEEKRIDEEKARIKFEKEQREKLPDRIKALTDIGEIKSESEHEQYATELLKLDDTGFTELLNRLTSEKLERQAKEQAIKEAELKAAADKVEADRRTVEEEKLTQEREKKHQAELEAARKEAAEKAKREAELDAKRKEDARIEAERQAKLEAERIEAEKPDKAKLETLASQFAEIPFPEVSGKKAQAKLTRVWKLVEQIVEELKAA